MEIDLGCGLKKQEGAIGVDLYPLEGVDVVADLFKFPWPFADGCADVVHCTHFFEHVPAALRPRFMEEVYRILKVGGLAVIVVPPWNSERAYQDWTHEWPPIAPTSMHYFKKAWRDEHKLTYGTYDTKTNFDIRVGSVLTDHWKARCQEVGDFSVRHYINSSTDLVFNLTKLEM